MSRRRFYKRYVSKKIQGMRLIFTLVILLMFGITLYDSFANDLPFYYVLFFLLGYIISLSFLKTQKISWDEGEEKIVRRMSIFGFLLIITLILARRVILPDIFEELNIIYMTDAILLTSLGLFAGRIHIIGRQIEETTFKAFLEKKEQ